MVLANQARGGAGQSRRPPFDRRVDGPRRHAGLQRRVIGAKVVAEPRRHQPDARKVRTEPGQFSDRSAPVGGGAVGVAGQRLLVAGALDLPDRGRRIAELRRTGNHRHGAHLVLQPADGADHLEGEERNAVAEFFQRQPLEDDVGGAPIGGRLAAALLRLDQAVAVLPLRAVIDAVVGRHHVERPAVGPYPTDPVDLAFTEADGKIGEVAVAFDGRAARPALAAAFRLPRHLLLEVRRPDHLAGDPHPPVDARDRRAFARGLDLEVGKPAGLRRPLLAEQRLVDGVAGDRAGRAPERYADRAEQPADRRAGSGENKGCHELPSSPGWLERPPQASQMRKSDRAGVSSRSVPTTLRTVIPAKAGIHHRRGRCSNAGDVEPSAMDPGCRRGDVCRSGPRLAPAEVPRNRRTSRRYPISGNENAKAARRRHHGVSAAVATAAPW